MQTPKNPFHLNKEFQNLLQIGNESNCRWVFHYLDKKKATACIGHPSKNRSTTTYHQFLCDSEGEKVEYPMLGGINVFFSVNQYFDYHINALLSQLHANYLDIDVINKKTITQRQSKQVLNHVLRQLELSKIPSPNAIVSSGSGGWHLYWAYEPVPAYKRTLNDWKQVTNKIISAIEPNRLYKIDTAASIDPGRVLRLPGTFHFESQNQCDCVEVSKAFTFEEMLMKLKIEKYQFPKKNKQNKPKSNRHGHNIKEWWAKIYYQLINHANDGFVGERHHNRDEFIFISYVALKHIHVDEQTAFDKAIELNNRFKLLSEEEAISNLSTARKTDYRFKKETLTKRLDSFFPNLNKSFLESTTPAPLDPEEVLLRQSKSALETNKQRVNRTQEKLTTALIRLSKPNEKVTLKAIAQESGISYRTVKKYKNFLQEQKGELRSPSIYPPARD